MYSNENVLTKKAHDFVMKRWIRDLSESDWQSIFLYRELERQREDILNRIMAKVDKQINTVLKKVA